MAARGGRLGGTKGARYMYGTHLPYVWRRDSLVDNGSCDDFRSNARASTLLLNQHMLHYRRGIVNIPALKFRTCHRKPCPSVRCNAMVP